MYAFDSRIRYSETDTQEKLKLESLIDYFQDCSSFQSEDRGVGFSFMREHHVAWIVNYWQIDIVRRPAFGEKVRTGTYPYGFKGFIGFRNFRMETVAGEKLADANSVWSLFDLERGIPVKVLPEMMKAYTLDPKFDMEYLPRKIKIPKPDAVDKRNGTNSGSIMNTAGKAGHDSETEHDGRQIWKQSQNAEGKMEESGGAGIILETFPEIPVSQTMLDSNGHVNNGQYVRIAMSLVGDESAVRRLRVEYVSQAHLGDVIVPKVYKTSDEAASAASDAEGKAGETPETGGKTGVRTIVLASEETGKPYAVVEVS